VLKTAASERADLHCVREESLVKIDVPRFSSMARWIIQIFIRADETKID
jgi:hypothetical protein